MGRFITLVLHYEIGIDIILTLQMEKRRFREIKYPIKDIPGQTQFLVQVNLTMTMNCMRLDQV